jgi:hypothetical protein
VDRLRSIIKLAHIYKLFWKKLQIAIWSRTCGRWADLTLVWLAYQGLVSWIPTYSLTKFCFLWQISSLSSIFCTVPLFFAAWYDWKCKSRRLLVFQPEYVISYNRSCRVRLCVTCATRSCHLWRVPACRRAWWAKRWRARTGGTKRPQREALLPRREAPP